MKKSITIFSLLLLLISTILPNGLIDKVEAAEAELEPGVYEMDYSTNVPKMEEYIESPIIVKVDEENKGSVLLKLNSQEFIEDLRLLDGESSESISKSERDGDFVYFQFNVDDVIEAISFEIALNTPIGPMQHKFDLTLDTNNAVAFESEFPELSESLTSGVYEMDYTVDLQAMNGYMEKPAVVKTDGQSGTVILKLNSQQYIDDLKLMNGGEGTSILKSERNGDYVSYQFDVDNITNEIPLKVIVNTGNRIMPHEFNVTLNPKSASVFEGKFPELSESLASDTYEMDYSVDVSAMNGFMEKPALVKTEGQSGTVILKLNSQKYIEDLQLSNGGSWESILRSERDGDFVSYQFNVDDISGPIPLKVIVNTGYAVMEHEFNVTLDTDNPEVFEGEFPEIEEVAKEDETEDEKDSEKPKEEKPKKDNKDKVCEDVNYEVDYSVDVEMMENFSEPKANIEIKNGAAFALLAFNSQKFIKDFEYKAPNGKYKKAKEVSRDNNIVKYEIPLDSLEEKLEVRIHEQHSDKLNKYPYVITFDLSKLPVDKINECLNAEPSSPSKDKKDDKNKASKKKNQKPEQSKLLVDKNESNSDEGYAEGTHPISIYIFTPDGPLTKGNLSSMNDYLVQDKSTVKIEKGKDPLVTMVLSDADLITDFAIKGTKVKRNDLSGNFASFTFAVKSLDDILDATIDVTPPGFNPMHHEIRIAFDTSEIPGSPGTNNLVSGFLNAGDDLTFDRFADGEQVAAANASIENKNINPKTDDMNYAKMSLFALLFLMSTALLGVFIRKRFVKSV